MEINGLPLHPLVVHAVVVLAPLSALAAIAYAVIPRLRWALRWPMVVATLGAVGAAVVAVQAGHALVELYGYTPEARPDVFAHQDRGELLRNVLLGFTVVVLLAAWRLGGPTGLTSGRGERPVAGGVVDLLATGLLVVGGLAVAVLVFLAGESGARAVWGA